MEINRTLRLSPEEYLQEALPKDLIVLHHTVGGTARSTFDFWQSQDERRVGTAYIVERDGTIFEVFDPKYWAFHLGVKGSGGAIDRRSIGIEIASEGGLTEAGGALYCFDKISPRTLFKGTPHDCGHPWRGYRFFDPYDAPQMDAVISLVDHLCTTFRIPRQTPKDSLGYAAGLLTFKGVIGHHHVRSDKSDVHPGFPWESLVSRCGLQRV